ncbi:hypothetical protein [Luteimonas terrae]|uniref:hypothetical protein n=1 Tax=Luteimonas terrae TaxID=1530191 RepID=UPI00286C42DD|nr:hypothetical protein [Luteimonas terrae]
MSTAHVPISRSAGDKTKGFRFQKLRACTRLLHRLELSAHSPVFCAMEFLEDSIIFEAGHTLEIEAEENKIYTSALTFQSPAILNTIVALLDLDGHYMHEGALDLSVFASAPIGNEHISPEVLSENGLPPSKKKFEILAKLVEERALDLEEAAIARHLILREFSKQYPDPGNRRLTQLSAWGPADFARFVERISWSISTTSMESLEEDALRLIRSCKYFSYRHEGQERYILSELLDLLERRSHSTTMMGRLVGSDAVELVFAQFGIAITTKPVDPAHACWGTVVAEDKRTVVEKLLAVAPDYSKKKLDRIQRATSTARYEALQFEREYVALRHRVLLICEEDLDAWKLTPPSSMINPDEVDAVIEGLVSKSMKHLESLSKTYHYRIQDEQTVRGLVLSLFDDCYVALD